MARFEYQKKQHTYRKFIISVCVFLLIVLLFYQGIESLSSGSVRRQRESLENALNRSITYCYAVEGSYPASLAYLEDHYGITYDHDKYLVTYEVVGSNLMPDVDVIPLKGGEVTP